MAENGNTTRTQLINLEGLSTFLDESKKIFEPTLPPGTNGQVLKLSGGTPTWGTDNTPTAFKWTNGTTAGPTGSLSGNGMTAVSFAAIPSAGASASGVVTTGAQTFAGTKTFNSPITGSLNGNASTATSADKTAHSLTVKDGASTPVAAINSWNGSADKTLTIKGGSPVTTTATDGTITITHDKKGPSTTAATSKGDTSNQAPGFGGTFKVTSATVDAYGHTTALADHTVTIPSRVASSEANGLMSSAHWSKLENIASGAEVNQNAFSNVKVGDTVVAADSKTDTLTLVAGSNVTITPDATNDKITIASSYVNTTYSAGTDLGLSGTTFNHANSGATAGTYRSVTVNARGHVTGGTNPTTLSGYGITDAKISNGEITLGSGTITPLTKDSTLAAGKVSGTLATGNIPNLDASKITSGTIDVARLPATALERCIVVADDTARFKLTTSSVQVGDTVKVTATKKMYMVIDSSKLSSEAGYEEYFTSTDWSTITNKPSSYTPSSHTHTKSQITDFPTKMPASDVYDWAKAKTKPSYAWSEITNKPSTFTPATHSHDAATQSANGFMSAADKKKLDGVTESADSVSFTRSLTSGTKVGTITINGAGTDLYAPTDTDTHYTAKNVVASSSTGAANVTAETSNPYLNLIENGAVRSAHQIKGSGATTVKTDTSGNIVISSTDTNTHYTATPVLGATDAVANATSKTSDPYLNIIENGGKSGGIQIKGSGATTVSAVNGVLTINSTDTNTTNVSATTTGSGNAVTSVTASGSAITVTRGASFLTAHQDISGKEDKSNKVTAWSSTTTDVHYPSEKLVKGALDTKVNTGDVLTLGQIQATTDLTGKVASASALKEITKLDLLWTNASPTSSFGTQDLYMDLTKYRAVLVEVCEYGGVQARFEAPFSCVAYKGVGSAVATYYHYTDANTDTYILSFVRGIYALDDRIYISDSRDNHGVNNVGAIPQKIWGIK